MLQDGRRSLEKELKTAVDLNLNYKLKLNDAELKGRKDARESQALCAKLQTDFDA